MPKLSSLAVALFIFAPVAVAMMYQAALIVA